MKTSRAAVVAIPPAAIWEPIQAIRRRHDRQIRRWMPHITLLYPFWPRARFDEAERLLAPACARLGRFAVTLRDFESFTHARSVTLWLAPEPAESLRTLQAGLVAAIPECDDTARFGHGFTPHLSVGQLGRDADRERLLRELRAGWAPLTFDVVEIALIAREGDEPFQVDRRLALG